MPLKYVDLLFSIRKWIINKSDKRKPSLKPSKLINIKGNNNKITFN